MTRKMTQDRTDDAKFATRKKSPRQRELTPQEQADLDAFRALQPLSQMALAKDLQQMIRRK